MTRRKSRGKEEIRIRTKSKILASVIVLSLLVTAAFGIYEALWTKQPTMLILYKNYAGTLVGADINSVGLGTPEVTAWARQPDDHHYQICIVLTAMNQIDTGTLNVTVAGVPAFEDINISSVSIVQAQNNGGVWQPFSTVVSLATNVPLGTLITFNKADALWKSGPQSPNFSSRAMLIELSEYQTGSSGSLTQDILTTTIELGAQF